MSDQQDSLILIVDDEEMNLIVLSKILKRAGFKIDTAENGQQAVHRAKEQPQPDIILMDLMMPKMSGWDATKILKEDQDTKHIPVFAVTALSNERDATKEFGFDGFCPKPIDFSNLIDLIKQFLVKTA